MRRYIVFASLDELAEWLDTYSQARTLPQGHAMQVILERMRTRSDAPRLYSRKGDSGERHPRRHDLPLARCSSRPFTRPT